VARSAVRNFDLGRAGGGLLSVTTTQRIAPELNALAIPLERLDSLPGNPRKGDVDAVARSYSTFGQRKPIVARRNGDRGIVIAGNHQLAAARQLGWSEIAVVWTDDDDETAAAFALADNRTAELGGYDDEALAAMISSVEDAELLAATGWSEDAIEELMASLDPEQLRPRTGPAQGSGLRVRGSVAPRPPPAAVRRLHQPRPPRAGDGRGGAGDRLHRPALRHRHRQHSGKVGHVGSAVRRRQGGKVIKTTEYLPVAGDDTTDVARDAFTLLMASYPKAPTSGGAATTTPPQRPSPTRSCWLVWDKENTATTPSPTRAGLDEPRRRRAPAPAHVERDAPRQRARQAGTPHPEAGRAGRVGVRRGRQGRLPHEPSWTCSAAPAPP
jgi:hypothetical protein